MTTAAATETDTTTKSGKAKIAAAAAGTGAAVAGIAIAARDSRTRVLGVPVGRRGKLERGASAVVDRVGAPVRKVGSRFSRG